MKLFAFIMLVLYSAVPAGLWWLLTNLITGSRVEALTYIGANAVVFGTLIVAWSGLTMYYLGRTDERAEKT
jgi:hypothetical protein